MNSTKIYIGDVHGDAILLSLLLEHIADLAEKEKFTPQVQFLGDIVDRGPDSRLCLDIVKRVLDVWEGSHLYLGNHDEMFLNSIKKGIWDKEARHWVNNCGGRETLISYSGEEGFEYLASFIREEWSNHLLMLEKARIYSLDGAFFVSHAGYDPMKPIHSQSMEDLLWIREPFQFHVDPRAIPAIHGHEIVGHFPVVTENRISLDTGAYRSGRLSCLLVDEKQGTLRFFQTRSGVVEEIEPTLHDRGFGTIFDRLPDLFLKQEAV